MPCHRIFFVFNFIMAFKAVELYSTQFFSDSWTQSGLWWTSLKCSHWQCCIGHNVENFEHLFDQNVFGQHIARGIVSKALKSHLRKIKKSSPDDKYYSGPSKALVMSFHGWTGVGKNYVAQFVVDSLYDKDQQKNYVHLFTSEIHFPDRANIDLYKDNIQEWIRSNVTKCAQSLFIFDEVDKMREGIIDAIKPFIDHHKSLDGVDYRQSIFILLSNTGGQSITKTSVKLFEAAKKREDWSYHDFEELVSLGAFNEIGGLHKSSVIGKSLVDYYVPFLPLERDHVKKCAKVEAAKNAKKLTPYQQDQVVNNIRFGPPEVELFSVSGCRGVSQRVDQILEESDFNSLTTNIRQK